MAFLLVHRLPKYLNKKDGTYGLKVWPHDTKVLYDKKGQGNFSVLSSELWESCRSIMKDPMDDDRLAPSTILVLISVSHSIEGRGSFYFHHGMIPF